MNTDLSNPVVHLELHTGDLPRALGFYARACGWNPERIQDPHGSYLALDLGRRVGAARAPRGPGRVAQRRGRAGSGRDRLLAAQALSYCSSGKPPSCSQNSSRAAKAVPAKSENSPSTPAS